jgi:extracellular factor (EF) 3-hydroxypalmitic acid methyl ester biosynthesis protein
VILSGELINARAVEKMLSDFVEQGRCDGVRELAQNLREIRSQNSTTGWKRLIDEVMRPHPCMDLLREDPMTHRCFFKPRGYAGDAVLLDLIYGHPSADPIISAATDRGRQLFTHTVACPGPEAVRNRRQILGEELDRAAADYRDCAVLSVACGHLRELELSEALRDHSFSRFVAFDQDPESLAEVERRYPNVETSVGSVKQLLATRSPWGESFGFIYAAGLYDYLSDRFAERLTASLLGMLKPGGRMLIANFLPDIADAGYLESVMDWWLRYRTVGQIEGFLNGCPSPQIGRTRLFEEPNGNIAFLEVFRC